MAATASVPHNHIIVIGISLTHKDWTPDELRRATEMFYRHEDLHFECTRCGRCCAAGGDYYVFLDPGEAETIRRHLGLSRSWFRRRYLAWGNAGERVLASRADGSCVLLDEQGHCRIYPARPVQCRTYPFWPELVARKTTWQKERRRCEGIDRGPAVARERIEAALSALKISDG